MKQSNSNTAINWLSRPFEIFQNEALIQNAHRDGHTGSMGQVSVIRCR